MNKQDKNYEIYLNNLENLNHYNISKEQISEKLVKHKKEECFLVCLGILQILNFILMIFGTDTANNFIKETIFLFIGIIVFTVAAFFFVPLYYNTNKIDIENEINFKIDCLLNNNLNEQLEYINLFNIKKIVKIEKGDIVLFNRFIKELNENKKKENIGL